MIRRQRHGSFDYRDVRALVIDDEAVSRAVAQKLLENLECGVVRAATDGREALDLMRRATLPFNLVVCDYQMPGMSGLEVLKAIRCGAPGIGRDVAFAMLTGRSDDAVVGAAFNLDVDCFIVKPVSASRFSSRLRPILSSDRPIRPPEDYQEVRTRPDEIAAAGEVAPPCDPAEPAPAAAADRKGRPVPLSEAQPGMILSEDLITRSGQSLLSRGYRLDTRVIERLRQLAEFDRSVNSLIVRVDDAGG